MAKKSKTRKYPEPKKASNLDEPEAVYRTIKKLPVQGSFPFIKFNQLMDLMPLTLNEWAQILHLSERTLQRYAKKNSPFEGIYADRIFHIQQLIQTGFDTFNNAQALNEWLRKEKKVLGYTLNFQSLQTTQGIQYLINQLERIQQGVYT